MDTPNFDLGIEELLEAKIAYHKEQAKFHARMAAETKDKLRVLQNNTLPPLSSTEQSALSTAVKNLSSHLANFEPPVSIGTSLLSAIPSSTLSSPNTSTLSEFSVTKWKPIVEKVLKEKKKALKTEDILKEIAPNYLNNEELRKKAIGVISSSLFSLVQNEKVTKRSNEGQRGNLYEIAE